MVLGEEMDFSRRSFCEGLVGLAVVAGAGLGSAAAEEGMPVVYWKVDPVGPGETLMLFGDGVKGKKVHGVRLVDGKVGEPHPELGNGQSGWEEMKVLEGDERCLMVEIPVGWKVGSFAVRVGDGKGVEVNRAEAWWVSGDHGVAVTAGTELRVFGRNFTIAGQGTTKVGLKDAKGVFHPLTVSQGNPYNATVMVPAGAAVGKGEVFVHNGFGGVGGWSKGVAVEVRAADAWPATIYDVTKFGAKGDSGTDDTEAIRAALAKAGAAGGGVVYLPRGIYMVTGQMTIPKRTVLKGESRDVTWLMVPQKTAQFNTVIAGGDEFAVEDLGMVARTPLRMIVAPDVPSMYTEYKPWGVPGAARVHDVFLRRLRVQHLHYEGRIQGKDPRREDAVGPSTVALAGTNLEISDSEIVSPGMPFVLHDTYSARVLRNLVHTGRNGWFGFWGARMCCFEGNTIKGQDLEASYGGFGNYGSTDGNDVSLVYIAQNEFLDGFGDEREAETFDSPGNFPWKGRVAKAGGSELAGDGVTWPENAFAGLALLICAGKGIGQHRRIVSNTATSITVDEPWEVAPDTSSVASVGPYRRNVVLYKNHSQDASVGIQLWGGGYNYLMDSNETVRTGGFWGTGAEYNRPNVRTAGVLLPCYFTQWINNTIKQPLAYNVQYYNEGGLTMWATLGILTRDTLGTPDAAVLVLGNLFRGNTLEDHSQILLGYFGGHRTNAKKLLGKRPPVGLDNLIEGNSVSDVPVGVIVEPGYEGTLVRKNTFVRVGTEESRDKWLG
jgi:hypothetical protein